MTVREMINVPAIVFEKNILPFFNVASLSSQSVSPNRRRLTFLTITWMPWKNMIAVSRKKGLGNNLKNELRQIAMNVAKNNENKR